MENLLVNTFTFGGILLIYVTIVFLIAQLKHDNSVMDIAYGPAFFVAAVGTLIMTQTASALPLLMTALIGAWSLRLMLRILRKNYGKPEDVRYAAWRTEWMKRGRLYFTVRSLLQINVLQGLIILIVALPFIIALGAPVVLSTAFFLIGGSLFALGLGIEALADYQLDAFLARKRAGTEPATLMTTGLFHYSRRPNYFGETLIWWGLAVMVLPLPFGFLAILSPLLITYIVTRVTGPMLEAVFLERYPTEYRAYMASTNYFIPGRPREAQSVHN